MHLLRCSTTWCTFCTEMNSMTAGHDIGTIMIGPEGGGAEGIRRGDARGREEGDAGEEGKAAADPPLLNHFVLLHLLLRCSSSHFTFSSSAFPSFTSTSCFFSPLPLHILLRGGGGDGKRGDGGGGERQAGRGGEERKKHMSKELRDKAAGPFLKGHDTVLVVYIHNCVHVCVTSAKSSFLHSISIYHVLNVAQYSQQSHNFISQCQRNKVHVRF